MVTVLVKLRDRSFLPRNRSPQKSLLPSYRSLSISSQFFQGVCTSKTFSWLGLEAIVAPWSQLLMNWGYPIVRETIYRFAENLLLDSSLINPWADVRAASVDLLKAFYYNPSFSEAKAWGDLPYEWCLDHDLVMTLTPGSYRWRDLIQSLWNGGKTTWQNYLIWHYGTLALTSPILGTAFKFSISLVESLQNLKQSVKSKNEWSVCDNSLIKM